MFCWSYVHEHYLIVYYHYGVWPHCIHTLYVWSDMKQRSNQAVLLATRGSRQELGEVTLIHYTTTFYMKISKAQLTSSMYSIWYVFFNFYKKYISSHRKTFNPAYLICFLSWFVNSQSYIYLLTVRRLCSRYQNNRSLNQCHLVNYFFWWKRVLIKDNYAFATRTYPDKRIEPLAELPTFKSQC